MQGHLVIVVGHSSDAQGARSTAPLNRSEFEYNSDIAARAKAYAKPELTVDVVFRPQRGFAGIRAAYEEVSSLEPDAAIELHFNAFNGKVKGTETLYADSEDVSDLYERELAQVYQDNICKLFRRRGRQDRGLKKRPRTTRERGWYNVNQTTLFPTILLEPFFGDEPDEAQAALDNAQAYAECLIDSFEEWLALTASRSC